ncbi:myocardin-like isoform X3 [Sinocyclocheilus grahami]|uniref:myocardin-like isoform X3 n=1 Tax=Sinocyclocheilus grahami TaxID=75366 RepID=UPI0007ACB64C|nr:PREDICTED: myocardin-like isoform X3 [Sinocyclocheilus grahami]
MTLLASERSLLIRNKFRSVLQLRIQNRRQQNELNAESGTKASVPDKVGEKEASSGLRQTEDGATQKSPPSGLTAQTAPDRSYSGAHRQKKARLAEDLSEKIQSQPGPLEHLQRHILPLENTSAASLPSDVFEDDNSSSASTSPEQLRMHQSPGLLSSPGQGGDQLLSDASSVATPISPNSVQCRLALLPATEGISQPMTMTVTGSNSISTTGRPKGMCMPSQTPPLLPKTAQPSVPPSHSILGGSLTSSRPPRPRKPRDSKPKMRKLKYHQYIPPDQRTGTGSGAGSASQKNNSGQAPPTDSSYSHLLQQQQVFLQLQILNQQQQLPVTNSENHLKISGTTPQSSPQTGTPSTNPSTPDTSPIHQAELLPLNLDDLTVSVLRQQLRKRGLPVSGTKPALLERLRPFQMPRHPLTPVPLCQLGTTLESTHPASLNRIPTSLDTSANSAPMYISPSGLAEQSLGSDSYLTSPSSTGSSPTLHRSSPPIPSATTWRPGQAVDELSVELEMRERMRSRPREGAKGTQLCESSLHPFLQQETGCTRGKPDTSGQELLFTCCAGDGKVNCCQLCDVIGQDFDLPMQITASPAQASPTVRSLEEELQEAIQRVQMDPSQSIDDILDETISCSDNSSLITDIQSVTTILSGSSPAPQPDQSQSTKRQKDDNFLSSPLCSSLLLELPPSPNNVPPLSSTPAPLPPPPICTTPPSSLLSRKRRSEVPAFDPADWLESLTSGLQPLTPPTAPFLESNFGLDSDLNVNRVLDLMVGQW